MRELLNISDNDTIKSGDTSETFTLSARNDNEPMIWSSDDKLSIHIDDAQGAHRLTVDATPVPNSNNLNFSSEEIAKLPAGKYKLELWATLADSGKQGIWPSDGMIDLTIDRNADSLEGGAITSITFDDFKKQVTQQIKDEVAKAQLDKHDVDLSDYAKKSDVPKIVYDATAKTLTINGQRIDLPADVDLSAYAKKSEVPSVIYNADTKTLTVNGVAVEIPASVDLSAYYTKSEVDSKLATIQAGGQVDLSGYVKAADADKKYATKDELGSYAKTDEVNASLSSVVSEIPSQQDLTPYAKTTDVNDKISSVVSSIPSAPDLTPYAKTSDVSASIDSVKATIPAPVDLTGYAKTSDIKPISLDVEKRTLDIDGQTISIPAAVDLSAYAKTDQIPQISYDPETKTLTLDGTKVEIPASVDLSHYYTKDEVDQKLAQAASGGKVDLSGYLTRVDADKEYAKKADVPDVSSFVTSEAVAKEYATKSEIPSQQDLTPYAKTADVDAKVSSVVSEIPSAVDLTSYATTSYVDSAVSGAGGMDDTMLKDLEGQFRGMGRAIDQVGSTAMANSAAIKAIPAVTLDTTKRTLAVGSDTITIPDSVDLSGYAKTDDVPKVVYDADKKTLTINGQTVSIPASVDLSDYYTKAEVDAKLKDAGSGTVDLTGYLKVTDADAKYATKAQVGNRGIKVWKSESRLYDVGTSGDYYSAILADAEKKHPDDSNPIRPGDIIIYTDDTDKEQNTLYAVVTSVTKNLNVIVSTATTKELPSAGGSGDNGIIKLADKLGSNTNYSINLNPLQADAGETYNVFYGTPKLNRPVPVGIYDLSDAKICNIQTRLSNHEWAPVLSLPVISDTGSVSIDRCYSYNPTTDADGFLVTVPSTVKPMTLVVEPSKLVLYVIAPYHKYASDPKKSSFLRVTMTKDYDENSGNRGIYVENLSDPVEAADLHHIASSTTGTTSAVKDILGDLVPKDVKSLSLNVMDGAMRVSYVDKDGKTQTATADNGHYNFYSVNVAQSKDSSFFTWSLGYHKKTSIAVNEKVGDQAAGSTIALKNIHVLSVDVVKFSTVTIHCILPTSGGDGDTPQYLSGGIFADIEVTGIDSLQNPASDLMAIRLYDQLVTA